MRWVELGEDMRKILSTILVGIIIASGLFNLLLFAPEDVSGSGIPPTLTSPSVTPALGNYGQSFNYSVTYSDSENDSPAYIYLCIDGMNYTMDEMDKSDTTYNDGKDYYFNVTLWPGNLHTYQYLTSDGTSEVKTPIMSGPIVENPPAVLFDPSSTPIEGNVTTTFNYSVKCISGYHPTTVNVSIDGTNHTMAYQRGGVIASGSEFLANTEESGDQSMPSVAMAPDRSFVITWESEGQDGDGFAIIAQRFDGGANKVGPEIQVNNYTLGNQRNPSVAMAPDRSFVVTWQSEGQDGDGNGIYAQRFAGDGSKVGTEFQVNSYTISTQEYPSISSCLNGNFVITWQSEGQDSDGTGIFAQLFDRNGNSIGPELMANTFVLYRQERPQVAMALNGSFAITWESYDQDGSGWGIYAQRFDSRGEKVGAEFLVNTDDTLGSQGEPSIGMSLNGSFVIAWEAGDAYARGIYAQRFGLEGQKVGNEFPVNTLTGGTQRYASVAVAHDGSFIITWRSEVQMISYDICAQLFEAEGNMVGEEFTINSGPPDKHRYPSTAMSYDGSIVVTWHCDFGDSHFDGSLARLYLHYGEYDYQTKLPHGMHNYAFYHFDGENMINTSLFAGPLSNYIPDLVFPDVSPPYGLYLDHYNYTVTYVDADNDTAVFVNISIDGVEYTMMESNVSDLNCSDGKEYYYNTTLPEKVLHKYRFKAYDGYQEGTTTLYYGPEVDYPIEVSNPLVTPQIGSTDTNFVYSIDQYDVEEAAVVNVSIDGVNRSVSNYVLFEAEGGPEIIQQKEFWYTRTTLCNYSAGVFPDGSLLFCYQLYPHWPIWIKKCDPEGNELASEIVISDIGPDRSVGRLAIASNGTFVVVWSHHISGRYQILARHFDMDLNALGPEYYVYENSNDQIMPWISMDSSDDFVVTWSENRGNGHDIYFRRFDQNGIPKEEAFRVNDFLSGHQTDPTVSCSSDGGFVITWESESQDGSGWGIFAKAYDSNGNSLGSEFQVNSYILDDQRDPSVCVASDSSFVISWESQNQDGDGFGIFARRFEKDGSPMSFDIGVNSNTTKDQRKPRMDMDEQGNYLISWQSYQQELGVDVYWGVYAQRYDLHGVPMGPEFLVNIETSNNQYSPVPEIVPGGNFTIFYLDNDPVGDPTTNRFGWRQFALNPYYRRYYYETNLDHGTHSYQFFANDENFSANTSILNEPTVDYTPLLINPSLVPTTGNLATPFNYSVTYTDLDNDICTFIEVSIDYMRFSMLEADPTDIDYTDGKEFYYNITLSAGEHTYQFFTSDGISFANSSLFLDPAVNGPPTISDMALNPSVGNTTTIFYYSVVYTDINNDTPTFVYVNIDGINYSMSETNLSDNQWDDGKQYFYTTTVPHGNFHTYQFFTSDGEYNSNSSLFNGPDVDYAPILSNSMVTPLLGNLTVHFNYSVIYSDADNNPPVFIKVIIDGLEFDLYEIDVLDLDYTDGKGYYYNTTLDRQDTFTYQFSTSDGTTTVNSSVLSGPVVDDPAILFLPRVTPGKGSTITEFYYDVYYLDPGDAPDILNLSIDGMNFTITNYTTVCAPEGPDFHVNSYTNNDQVDPSIAVFPNGTSVIVWSSWHGPNLWGIYGQYYDTNGVKIGGEFLIEDFSEWDRHPDVAVNPATGDLVVVWDSTDPFPYTNVYMKIYHLNGTVKMPSIRINTYTTNYQENPAVACSDNGNIIVAWNSDGQDGSNFGVYAQRLDSDGNKIGAEFKVNTNPDLSQEYPDVMCRTDNRFIIVWMSTGAKGIYGQKYNSDGSLWGSEFKISGSNGYYEQNPSIARDSSDNCIVVWRSSLRISGEDGIYFQRYHSSSTKAGSETLLASTPDSEWGATDVACNYQGDYLVTWDAKNTETDEWDVFLQKIANNGTPVGEALRIGDNFLKDQREIKIGMGQNSEFIVVWQSYETDGDNEFGIFGKRFLNFTSRKYSYITTLSHGAHTYQFFAEDDFYLVNTSLFMGPNVDYPPALTDSALVPSMGNSTTVFNFSVIYTDLDNDTCSFMKIEINSFEYDMIELDPSDTNYSDGKMFYYESTVIIGNHTYQFFTSDGSTNVNTTIFSGPNVDDTPPNTTIEIGDPKHGSAPIYITTDTWFTLLHDNDGGGVGVAFMWYIIDSGPAQKYVGPFNVPVGTTTIEWGSEDLVGNNETGKSLSVIVDDIPPTSYVSTLTTHTDSMNFDVFYTVDDGVGGSGVKNVTLWYKKGADPWTVYQTDEPVDGVIAFTGSGDGIYQFYTIAADNISNTELPPSGNDTWTIVDTTEPASSVNNLPMQILNNTFAVTVTATDANDITKVELWYKTDIGPWTVYGEDDVAPWSWDFDTLATGGDGVYQFYSRAYDGSGNYEDIPAVNDTWTAVDSTDPISSVNILTAYTTTRTFTVTVLATDANGISEVELWYNRDGSGWTYYGSDVLSPWSWDFDTLTTGGDGLYQFYSRAYDGFGRYEDAPAGNDTWIVVDTLDPTSNAESVLPYWVNTSPLTITANADDEGSGIGNVSLRYRYSMDNNSWGTWQIFGEDTNEPWSWDFNFPEGEGYYDFYTVASDIAGNTEDLSAIADTACAYDITSPNADAGSKKTVPRGTIVTFDGSASTDTSGIMNYTWTFDYNGVFVTLYGPTPLFKFDITGNYTVTLKVWDAASNGDIETMLVDVTSTGIPMDNTAPVSNAGPDRWVTAGVPFTFDGSGSTDNIGIVNYSWSFLYNDAETILYGVSPMFTFWTHGKYFVTLTVIDEAGNSDTDKIIITVEDAAQDTDNDGTPDVDDPDDDNDGFLDEWEEFLKTDPKVAKSAPLDTDGDGIPDGDGNNSQLWMDFDDDNDGLTDVEDPYPQNPKKPTGDEKKSEGGFGAFLWLILIIILILILILVFFMKRKSPPLQEQEPPPLQEQEPPPLQEQEPPPLQEQEPPPLQEQEPPPPPPPPPPES